MTEIVASQVLPLGDDRSWLGPLAVFPECDALAVHAAFEHMKQRGQIELIWGPLRHGAGHNIVFYFRDYTGNIIEYSAEEEIILNDATYVPRAWPVTDPRAGDEWHLSPIPAEMM